MWWEQEKPQTRTYTHAHNVRTAYCYFVQAVKICPGQRESPQKQQLSCFSEETSGVYSPSTCCMSDMLAGWSYFFSLILSGNGPRFLKRWLPNSHHLCSCTHFKDLVAVANRWWTLSCAVCMFKMSDWHARISINRSLTPQLNPSGTDFCRAVRIRPRILSTRTSNLTAVTFLWTLFSWKVWLGSASEKTKIKQCTSWFSCILLPFELKYLFFPAAHYCFPFLGLPAASGPTKIPIPWPCDIRAPNMWPVSARNGCEKSLQHWCSNRVSCLSREAFCRELALGRYMPVLHLSTYQSKFLAILFLFWKDAQIHWGTWSLEFFSN